VDNKGSELNSFLIVDYDYEGSNGRVQSSTITSSVIEVPIYKEELKLINTVNVNYVSSKGIYEYTFIAINSGDVILKDVIIQDNLVPNIKFISGSIKVNNCIKGDADITHGVDIGEILPGNMVTVSFKVKVVGMPVERKIFNKGKASYISERIEENQNDEVNYSTIESNSVVVNVILGDIKITAKNVKSVILTDVKVRNVVVDDPTNSVKITCNDNIYIDNVKLSANATVEKKGTNVQINNTMQ